MVQYWLGNGTVMALQWLSFGEAVAEAVAMAQQ